MPAGGADGFGVTAFAAYPLIKFAYMTPSHTLMMDSDRITCLTEGPFKVIINIAAKIAVTSLAAAAVSFEETGYISFSMFDSFFGHYFACLILNANLAVAFMAVHCYNFHVCLLFAARPLLGFG